MESDQSQIAIENATGEEEPSKSEQCDGRTSPSSLQQVIPLVEETPPPAEPEEEEPSKSEQCDGRSSPLSVQQMIPLAEETPPPAEPPVVSYMTPPYNPKKRRHMNQSKNRDLQRKMGIGDLLKQAREKFMPEEGEILSDSEAEKKQEDDNDESGWTIAEEARNRKMRRQTQFEKIAATQMGNADSTEKCQPIGPIAEEVGKEKEEGELSDASSDHIYTVNDEGFIIADLPPEISNYSPDELQKIGQEMHKERGKIVAELSVWQKAQFYQILQDGLQNGKWDPTLRQRIFGESATPSANPQYHNSC